MFDQHFVLTFAAFFEGLLKFFDFELLKMINKEINK